MGTDLHAWAHKGLSESYDQEIMQLDQVFRQHVPLLRPPIMAVEQVWLDTGDDYIHTLWACTGVSFDPEDTTGTVPPKVFLRTLGWLYQDGAWIDLDPKA